MMDRTIGDIVCIDSNMNISKDVVGRSFAGGIYWCKDFTVKCMFVKNFHQYVRPKGRIGYIFFTNILFSQTPQQSFRGLTLSYLVKLHKSLSHLKSNSIVPFVIIAHRESCLI